MIHSVWDPYFYKSFAGYASIFPSWDPYAAEFPEAWPSPSDFNRLASHHQVNNLQFILQEASMSYEQMIYSQRKVPMRLNHWHDFFNNLSWLSFPQMKWALINRYAQENNLHQREGYSHENDAHQREGYSYAKSAHQRTSRQNLLAHLDECGIVLCSAQPACFEMVKQFEWKSFFWETRGLAEVCEPFIIGHGLLEKCLSPYIGITGKAILLPVEASFFSLPKIEQIAYIDQAVSRYILSEGFPDTPKSLHPFPFLGWPGWHAGNRCASFYDNRDYFRSKP